MEAVYRSEDTLTNKISLYLLILLLAVLPFDRFYAELLLICFAVHTLIHVQRADWKKLANPYLLLLQSVYLLTVLSTLYTKDSPQAFSFWGRQMAIFLFPVLLLLNRLDLGRYREKLLLGFTCSCILSVCFLFQDAFRTIAYYHLPLSALYSEQFLNHNFSAPLGIHATYLSMYAALSAYWLMMQLYRPLQVRVRLMVVAGLVLLVAALIQLGSRAVMISILVTASVVFPLFHAHARQRIRTLFVTVPVLLLLLVVILSTPVLRERFYDDLRSDLSSTSLPYTTADPRGERWELAIALIQRSPLIGYGSGDEVDRLQNAYFNHKLYHSYLFKLNAHNQYLSFLLRSGIAGLLVWLATLFLFARLAFKTKDLLFLSFILLLSIVGLSENFLDVNKGIFFYAFFAGVFTVIAGKKREAASRELREEGW